jgi:hypothetical protein
MSCANLVLESLQLVCEFFSLEFSMVDFLHNLLIGLLPRALLFGEVELVAAH